MNVYRLQMRIEGIMKMQLLQIRVKWVRYSPFPFWNLQCERSKLFANLNVWFVMMLCGFVGPGQTLSDRANSSSKSTPKPPSNVLVEQEHDEIEPLAQSSDIQLIEQTEGRVVEDERESPSSGGLSRINVRAFKLVEVIRRLARERAANGDGNEQGELPTFNELVVGCSRGTVARAFYSLLCLVNARFIDVEQEQAYGTIKMMASDYF